MDSLPGTIVPGNGILVGGSFLRVVGIAALGATASLGLIALETARYCFFSASAFSSARAALRELRIA